MEPYEDELFKTQETPEQRVQINRRVAAGVVALLGVTGIALSYGVHERNRVEELTTQTASAKTTTDLLQAQVKALTARLNDLSLAEAANSAPHVATPSTPAPSAEESVDNTNAAAPAIAAPATSASPNNPVLTTPPAKPVAPKHAATKRRPVVDKRYSQLKAQLDDQQKQLKDTADQVAKNRADLEGSLSSTRDELNGSIAKTHDELVLLEKRGERSFTEFDLAKGKQFQRVGPITLSLRKTDTKHKNYDLAMIVDDNELNKKKVNLYEPVWIHMENGGQPVQIVVNHVDKNGVHGYVSAPKYKQSELATLSPSSPTPGESPVQQTPQQ